MNWMFPSWRGATLALVLLVTLSVASPRTSAYGGLGNFELSREEVALLPEFCRHTQVILVRHGSANSQREWIERVGPAFLAMHHYCVAVVAYVRSHRHSNSKTDRIAYLSFAEDNQTYVVDRIGPDFALRAEIYYRRGQARSGLGKLPEALSDLEKAVESDPKHVRANHELSQVLLALGERERASKVLRAALERVPGNRLLESSLEQVERSPKKR